MIPEHVGNNFQTLVRAIKNGDACLLEVKDKQGNFKYVICCHEHDPEAKDGLTEELKPFARIFEFTEDDNPYELYNADL